MKLYSYTTDQMTEQINSDIDFFLSRMEEIGVTVNNG